MNLAKTISSGEVINLSKSHAGVKRLRIGLSWDEKEGVHADLDAALVVLGDGEKMAQPDSLLYFNSPSDPADSSKKRKAMYDRALIHTGDERTGAADGDDESIIIDLDKLPSFVKSMVATISIYDCNDDGTPKTTPPVTFGRVKNASAVLYNDVTGEALYKFDLTEDASNATAVEMARVYLHNGEWRYKSLGDIVGKSRNGLSDIFTKYKK